MFLDEYASFILENRKNGMSCGDIAAALGSQFGTIRGFSERSVRSRCAQQGETQVDFYYEVVTGD